MRVYEYRARRTQPLTILRLEAGVSQDVAGQEIGRDRSHVSRVESGEYQLTLDQAKSLAPLYDVCVSDLWAAYIETQRRRTRESL